MSPICSVWLTKYIHRFLVFYVSLFVLFILIFSGILWFWHPDWVELTGIMLLRDLSVSLIYPNWTTTNARKCEQSYDVTRYIKHPTTWWRHQMETFSPLLARSAGNPPVIGEFPSQMPVKRSFYIFFDLRLNKRLSKLSRGWWFETPWRPLWRHCNEICARLVIFVVVVVVVVTWYSAIWPISFGATSQALGQ